MGLLRKNEAGRLEFDGRVLEPGEEIELRLWSRWVRGRIDSSRHFGDAFVDGDGGIEVIGLEGVAARLPGSGSRADDLSDAYKALMTAAKEAAILLNEIGFGKGTYSRIEEALRDIQQLSA